MECKRFVGMDVHLSSISVAVAEKGHDGPVLYVGRVANEPGAISKLMRKLGRQGVLHCCYEAGPCGYVIYRQLKQLGITCEVIAPSLIPKKPGDMVKTDRKDAMMLAEGLRAGYLTSVWVPDDSHEALRDLVRSRESAKADVLRAKQRLKMMLNRNGVKPSEKMNAWTVAHLRWLATVKFDQRARQQAFTEYYNEVKHRLEQVSRIEKAITEAIEQSSPELREVVAALECMRGISSITSATLISEIGQFMRFANPAQLSANVGLVPSEHSSGGPGKAKRGGITKTGNAHIRRVLVEAAWHYRHRPNISHRLKTRQKDMSEAVKEISWKAQHRLHNRYWRLLNRGKPSQVAITAVARELLCFVWSVATQLEYEQLQRQGSTQL